MTRPAPARDLVVRGARVNNLKGIDLDLPRNRLTVVTGVSGSGKTSLAFDTLFVEGQRRYVESFPPDARRLLARLDRPDADRIEHVPPAIALRQDAGRRFGPRATLATITEIHDSLRTLFTRLGRIVCPQCGVDVVRDDPARVVESINRLPGGTRWQAAFPLPVDDADPNDATLREAALREAGFTRVIKRPAEWLVVVDRLVVGSASEARDLEAIETAFQHGDGTCVVLTEIGVTATASPNGSRPGGVPPRHSASRASSHAATRITSDGREFQVERRHQDLICGSCGTAFVEPEPRLFSFHSPLGACPACQGTGERTAEPRRKSSPAAKTASPGGPCPECNGDRLRTAALAVRLPQVATPDVPLAPRPDPADVATVGPNIAELCRLSSQELLASLAAREQVSEEAVASTKPVIEELRRRLAHLVDLGLGDLPLDRAARSLSAGEARRAVLAGTLSAALTQALYVLDEPSAGLHPRDTPGVLRAVKRLRDVGNTVVVVEHEESFLDAADLVVEIGPGAGTDGGRVTFHGPPSQLRAASGTVTGPWLTGELQPRPPARRDLDERPRLAVSNCRANNLRDVSAEFPLGALCVVTGVSGAGKSSLLTNVRDAAVRLLNAAASATDAVARWLPPVRTPAAAAPFEEVVLVDQSPLPGSLRSTPATCVKAFDLIRRMFAETPEAQVRNYGPGHFGFHTSGGRCPKCEGVGRLTVDMQFLPDVTTTCPECGGSRFQREILDIKCRGLTIAETLALSVRDAWSVFTRQARLLRRLQPLRDVGLDYLPLGQPVSTLSGGERQRLKLAIRLAGGRRARTLFLLDEPTTGLHRSDVATLLSCFDNLLAVGHSLLVVENRLDVVRAADWLIELGPAAGRDGGRVMTCGPPPQPGCGLEQPGRRSKPGP